MKLPWRMKEDLKQKEQRIQRLEDEIEDLEGEKESYRKRYEAEKERRSRLSTEKQEAEEKLNRLEQSSDEEDDQKESAKSEKSEFKDLSFQKARELLRRLGSMESSGNDLVTVYSPEKPGQISDLQVLKNSVPKNQYSALQENRSFVAFSDPVLGVYMLKMSAFFTDRVSVTDSFEPEKLTDFIESEKYWCTVSAGETEIYREENGEFEQVERIKNRIDREHSKGGFSQARFERKRDEQIEQHIDQVSEALEQFSDIYLIGDKKLCKELEGNYLGGIDPNRKKPEQFYKFRFRTFF